jgi:hypothetical protein
VRIRETDVLMAGLAASLPASLVVRYFQPEGGYRLVVWGSVWLFAGAWFVYLLSKSWRRA